MKKEMAVRKEITEETVKRAKLHNIKRAKVKSILIQLRHYRNIIGILKHCTDDEILLESRQ